MGRSKASARDKRAEKAKVKLKGHTTKFLPKGLNVTKTAFKVRKIVLQEQLRTQDGGQPLTKRKLNVKEVLSRLQHYSSSHREEGLGGLGELLGQMDRDQLSTHLSSIIDNLAKLCLDGDSKVRRLSALILTSVFSLVSETQLLPFCSVLGSYLSCAMTHIQLGVQEDSLMLLDALLEKAPALAAASVHQILPCVLDMISRSRSDHQSGRQLSLQLSSNLISSIWRAKVFGRLQALLVVSLLHRKGTEMQETRVLNRAHYSSLTISVDPMKKYSFPLYKSIYSTPVCLSKIFQTSTASSTQLLDDSAQLRSFVESIMPLMLDSWMEVNPLSLKKSNKKAEDNGLTVEPALILHCVLEIIDLLWQHLLLWEKENARYDLTEWFKNTYVKDVNKFLGKGFPYVPRVHFSVDDDVEGESQGSGRKRFKTKSDTVSETSLFKLASPFLLKDKDEHSCTQAIAKCVLQNLALCHLLVSITKSPSSEIKEKILEILTAYLNQWGGSLLCWSDHLLRALRSVFEKSSGWTCDLNPLLSAVVSRYYRSLAKKQTSHQAFASKLCDLLVEASLHQNFQHLLRYESFSSWFVQLPSSLSHGDVTIDKLCVLNKLASQNNAVFLKGLQNAFTSILDAVSNFPLKGENQAEKEAGLASLFYWVNWNEEQVSSLKALLNNKKVSASLTKKIINILLLRQEKFQVLAEASWLIECI